MPIGFLSEHSVEFVLVPQLISILSKTYSNIVPFYFWAAHEGNSVSHSCDTGEYIRLIAVYPRRPKVSHPHDSEILIKFNAALFEKAREYEQSGIPVFAGVPRVSSIMDFRLNTPCSWFEILGAEGPTDIEGTISLESEERWAIPNNDVIRGPLSKEQLVNSVKSRSALMRWDEAIRHIREVRKTKNYTHFFTDLFGGRFGGYKPFYLMLSPLSD